MKGYGINFLHNHPKSEEVLKVDKDHVIVDKKDWEIARDYFVYQNHTKLEFTPYIPKEEIEKVKTWKTILISTLALLYCVWFFYSSIVTILSW